MFGEYKYEIKCIFRGVRIFFCPTYRICRKTFCKLFGALVILINTDLHSCCSSSTIYPVYKEFTVAPLCVCVCLYLFLSFFLWHPSFAFFYALRKKSLIKFSSLFLAARIVCMRCQPANNNNNKEREKESATTTVASFDS